MHRAARGLSAAVLWSVLLAAGSALAQRAEPPIVPYVPTAKVVVDKMLDMAKVGKGDIVYDLGCGDGRIVIAAVKERGARRGVGIDINPERISEANRNARDAGVQDKVEFRVGDLFEADFSEASVVTLYLLPEVNLALRPILWKQLKVGTRVVSHDFHMGDDWPPERTEQLDHRTVYAWTIRPEHKKKAR